METTNQSVESAVEALMAPVESETAEVETTESYTDDVEEAEVEEAEVDDESYDDDAEYAESEDDDEDDGEEYLESDEEIADQVGPETFSIKVDGEDVEVTLDDLKRDYSGQSYIQKGMKQAAEQRKQAEEAFSALNQQRTQLDQLMQQVQQQGVMKQPTPPSKELLGDDPLGYIEAEATYREEMGQYQTQRQQIAQQQQAMQQAQGQAHQAYLQEQMTELTNAIPALGDATKAPKLKEALVKQGVTEGYSAEEIGGISDARAMKVLHKAMMYDRLMAGKGTAEAKLKKAKPLIKAGVKKQPDSAAKTRKKQMSQLRKSGSAKDAAALLFS